MWVEITMIIKVNCSYESLSELKSGHQWKMWGGGGRVAIPWNERWLWGQALKIHQEGLKQLL